MNIRTRIKVLAILLLTAPANIVKASAVNMAAPLSGVAPDPSPISTWGNLAVTILNIALIPLAIITMIFYYLDKKNVKKPKEHSLAFTVFLILFIVAVVSRIVIPIVADYLLNTITML